MTQSRVEELINDLLIRFPKGFDLSLTRITRLLEALGNPHLRLPPIIHIAGTNGKGSAAANCRALLESAGYSVHVHTSPHLVYWNERYRLGKKGGGSFVDDKTLADALQRVTAANNNQPITVFEILTAVAFLLFAEHPADAVILEVGLGGRFDATNVIPKPAVSLIMPIALDHTAFLGDTVEKIAFEKAGIIKHGAPVVIGKQESDSALDVLTDIAAKKNAPCKIFGQDYQGYEDHGRMVFQNEDGLKDLPLPKLSGDHQIANSTAAIEAVLTAGFKLTDEAIANAMHALSWPARMQKITHGRIVDQLPKSLTVFLDGGHNPAGAQVIANELRHWQQKGMPPIIMITGMINTKDSVGYFSAFKGLVEKVYTVPVLSSESGVPAETLCDMAKAAGLTAEVMANIDAALHYVATTTPHQTVLIGGSLYLAGEFLQQNNTPPQ